MGLFQKMSLYEAFALLCSRKSSKKDLEKATKIICALPPDDRRSAPYMFLCMVRSQHVGVAYEALRHEEDKGELPELMLSVLDLPVVFDEFQAAYQSGTDSPLAAIYVARAYESGWGIEKNHEKAVEVVRAWGDVPGAYANEAEKIRKVILSADKPKAPAPSAAPKAVDTIFGKVNVADKPTQTTPVNKSAKATKSTACDDTKNRSAMSADEAFDIAQTLWEQKKYEEANRYYEIAAQQGHAKAMNCLGCLYRYGEGVKKDIEKALDYFEAALTAGNPKGGANIGMVYYNGEEGEPDFDKAFPYLLKAARAGVSYVMPALSDLYYCGEGCEENMKLAAYWAYQSIEHEENDGYYMLGIFFKDGYFFPQCLAKSKYCFERAKEIREDVDEFLDDEMYEGLEPVEPMIAPFNDSDASFFTQECPFRQYQQALALLHGVDEDGNAVSVDPAAGLKLLELSAEQGYAAAQFCLGAKYLNSNEGDGIRYDEDGAVLALGCDNRKATHYLDLAAEQGHPDALRIMIPLYAVGDIDVQKNTEKSNEYKALKNKLFQNDEDDEDEDEDEDEDDEDEEDKDEWESLDSISELYAAYKNPEEFDNPNHKNIYYGCKLMESFYTQLKSYFDETAYAEANFIVCEILCIDRDACVAHMCEKFNFLEHIDFEEWLLEAMNFAADIYARTEDTDGIDTPVALLNFGYYLYYRTMPCDEKWLMPYISCRYYSGDYDDGLAMGVLMTARYYVSNTDACEIDSEDTDDVLSFWEENYGESLNAALEQSGALYCDGYVYISGDSDADDDSDGDTDDEDTVSTFTTQSGDTFTGYTDADGSCVGWGRIDYSDGDSYEGLWTDGQRDIFGIDHSGSDLYIGMFAEDRRSGIGILKERNVRDCCPVTGTYFVDGEETALNTDFNYGDTCTLGKLYENCRYYGHLRNGYLQGWARTWTYYADPVIYKEGMFYHGHLYFGVYASFYDNDTVLFTYGHYDDDSCLCTVRSDEVGHKVYIRCGQFQTYDSGSFSHNMLHGEGTRICADGLRIHGTFENGKLTRIIHVIKPNGKQGDPDDYTIDN